MEELTQQLKALGATIVTTEQKLRDAVSESHLFALGYHIGVFETAYLFAILLVEQPFMFLRESLLPVPQSLP